MLLVVWVADVYNYNVLTKGIYFGGPNVRKKEKTKEGEAGV